MAAHNHNKLIALFKFQHTATRRWLHLPLSMDCLNKHVSTHSHPKVAATAALHTHIITKFQHTATRRWLLSKTAFSSHFCEVSTHSHPKVAAGTIIQFASNALFQHTATRRWLHPLAFLLDYCAKFQHTATRRWLPGVGAYLWQKQNGFNTQPPEGGCRFLNIVGIAFISFNTQPPEGGCKWTT